MEEEKDDEENAIPTDWPRDWNEASYSHLKDQMIVE
jgi:hypothetical protein